MKAVAILAVVCTHAGPPVGSAAFTTWDHGIRRSWVEFHVPSFLLLAGFLYARSVPISCGEVGRRLVRVLLPYAIASIAARVLALELGSAPTLVFALLTGSALGIYYFVFVLAICIVISWALSRFSVQSLVAILLLLATFSIAQLFIPALQFDARRFTLMRNPLSRFYLGYFVLGWLLAVAGAPHERRLRSGWTFALCVLAAGVWFWTIESFPTDLAAVRAEYSVKLPARVGYTLAVVAAITACTTATTTSSLVRLLSDATLTIYLYHRFIQIPLFPHVASWHPPFRIACLWLAGTLGPLGLALVGRKVLGQRWARTLLGA